MKSRLKSRKLKNDNSSFLGSIKSTVKGRGSTYSSAKNSARKSVNGALSKSGKKSRRKQKPSYNGYKSYERIMDPF